MVNQKDDKLDNYHTQCSVCKKILGTYPSLTKKRIAEYNVTSKAQLDLVYTCRNCTPSERQNGLTDDAQHWYDKITNLVVYETKDRPLNTEQLLHLQ